MIEPNNNTSGFVKELRSIVNPKSKKKKVRIRKENSEVRDLNCRMIGERVSRSIIHFVLGCINNLRLLSVNPNTKIMNNDGKW